MGVLDALVGIKTIIDATSGTDIVLTPMRKALRFKGTGFLLTVQDDAIDVELTGDAGAQGPQGIAGPTGPTGAAGTLKTIGRLDTTHSPKLLWSFDSTLNDASGNSHTATVDSGTIVYSSIWPGYVGASFQSCRVSLVHADVRLIADLTVECIVLFDAAPAAGWLFIADASGDASSTTNICYGLRVEASRLVFLLWENGTGADVSVTSTGIALPPPGVPFHLAYTRISNVHRIYINGVLAFTSGTLAAPTGGSATTLYVGGAVASFHPSVCIGDFKLIDSGLSGAQVLVEAQKSIGQLYVVP